MKVLTYNVHGWRTLDDRPNVDAVAAVIGASGADIVALNEVFHLWTADTGQALSSVAARLGLHFAFGPTQPAPSLPAHPPYGNAILSRWPILAYAAHHLAPTTAYGRRGLLEARLLLPAGRLLTVYVTHLDHRSEEVRLAQWAAAMTWLQRDRNRPHLLLGDFNALAASDYATPGALAQLTVYQQTQGWPPPSFALIEQVLRAGYVDAHAHIGAAPTYPALAPERRIDYIFLPPVLSGGLRGCARLETAATQVASDHLPVLAEIDWP